jgi:hypothetical protein
MNPQGMRRIRQTSVGKGIASEQVAEFVLCYWLRDAEDGKQSSSNREGHEPDGKDAERLSARQFSE